MLSFFVNDEELDFKHTNDVGFVYRSGLFGFAGIGGNRSFELSFPITSKNKRLFGHIDQPSVINANKFVRCRAFFNGAALGDGRLMIRQCDKDFSAYFFPNQASVDFLDKKLAEFDLGDDISLGLNATAVATEAQTDYPNQGYGWPTIYAPNFYGGENEHWKGWVNPKGSGGSLINQTGIDGAENQYAFAPAVYTKWLIEKIFDLNGFKVKGNLLENDDFKNHMLVSNYALDEIDGTSSYQASMQRLDPYKDAAEFRFLPCLIDFQNMEPGTYTTVGTYSAVSIDDFTANNKNYGYYTVQAGGYHRVKINNANFSGKLIGVGADESYMATMSLQLYKGVPGSSPTLVHAYEMKKEVFTYGEDYAQILNNLTLIEDDVVNLENFFNFTRDASPEDFEFQFALGDQLYFQVEYTAVNRATKTVVNGYLISRSLDVEIENISTADLNVYKKEFNLTDAVPDITAKQLIDTIKTVFNASASYDLSNRVLYLSALEGVVTAGKIYDWSDKLVSRVDIEFTPGKRFRFEWKDEYVEDDYFESTTDASTDGLQRISPELSPVRRHYGNEIETEDATRPLVPGESMMSDMEAQSEFYGKKGTERVKLMANNQAWIGRGFDLAFRERNPGQRTIINTNYGDSLVLMSTSDVHSCALNLDLNDISLLKSEDKILLNGVLYYWLELQVAYGRGKINKSNMKLLKIKP